LLRSREGGGGDHASRRRAVEFLVLDGGTLWEGYLGNECKARLRSRMKIGREQNRRQSGWAGVEVGSRGAT